MTSTQPLGDQKQANSVDMLNFLRVAATMFVFLLHGRENVAGIGESPVLFNILSFFPAWAGVWILFFLSGYLMQKGFLSNRYAVFEGNKLNPRALGKFYLKRFLKIAPAYYIYLLLFLVLNRSTYFFDAPLVALKILTFSFNGNNGIIGIGHLWYISLAMWLYLLAPFFYWLTRKLNQSKLLYPTFFLVVGLGFLLRYLLYNSGLLWYTWVYTFLPCNFDLFFGGMLACSVTEQLRDKIPAKAALPLKITSLTLFFTLTFYNCYVYWAERFKIYQLILPTVYLVVCALLLICYDSHTVSREKPTLSAIRRNPLRLIDRFSPHTYSFYIFHICVFGFVSNGLSSWARFGGLSVILRYLIFFTISFLITLLLSVLFDKMLSGLTVQKKKN